MEMDLAELAKQLTAFLTPLLPYLIKAGNQAGDKLAEEAGQRFGDGVLKTAQQMWSRLFPKISQKAAAQEAVDDVVESNDEDSIGAFRLQLKKLLVDDQRLAEELSTLLGKQPASVVVTAGGERSVAVGGNVADSNIITGDGHAKPPIRKDTK